MTVGSRWLGVLAEMGNKPTTGERLRAMTRDNRALLEAFCEWLFEHSVCGTGALRSVPAFLAECQTTGESSNLASERLQADALGLTVPVVNAPCIHGIAPGQCSECDGGSSPEMESEPDCEHRRPGGYLCPHCSPPVPLSYLTSYDSPFISALPTQAVSPAPQRYWRVMQASTDEWMAYACWADGKEIGNISAWLSPRWRETRAEAVADGAASGLPAWPVGPEDRR